MQTIRNIMISAAILAFTTLACNAHAEDLPKRKSGLWEIRSQMEGMPTPSVIQNCVDQNSDNIMRQRASEKQNCSVMDVKHQGNTVTIHSVCQIKDKTPTTATTDAVITGSFDSGYKNDMTISYNPPMHDMSKMQMTQETKWLGACKPGQKPGDVVMPGRGNFNMNDMMKDPKMQEMIKQHQQE